MPKAFAGFAYWLKALKFNYAGRQKFNITVLIILHISLHDAESMGISGQI
jgi:hypothetical protein